MILYYSQSAAADLRKRCTVFALGVGQDWDAQELVGITGGNPARVFVVDNYPELANAAELALQTICGGNLPRKACIIYVYSHSRSISFSYQ